MTLSSRWFASVCAVTLATASLAGGHAAAAARIPADDRTPRLMVLLVVDQFRADYIDKYHQQWSHGLRRLVTDGAWFREAYYPYFNTLTCPGHVSVSTGATPAVHGIVLNSWWDSRQAKTVTCTEDDDAVAISYGRPIVGGGESAARIQVPTLADELRAQRSPAVHTIAFSLKPRSAVTLGGRRPDAVAWFDDTGSWATSSAFTSAAVPAVADFVRQNPVENDFGRTWDRTLSREAYLYEDPAVGLRPARGGMAPSFPHLVKGNGSTLDRTFYDQWQSSPFADDYLARMALSVAESMGYGASPGPNLVAISFSTLDKVGHDYGPNSHEVQDVLIRLDRTLGDLFAGLDRLVGPGRYTVALTSDHGVAPVPERSAREGLDAGRLPADAVRTVAEQSMTKSLGVGQHVAAFVHDYLYLQPGVYEKLQGHPGAMHRLIADLTGIPGVLRVYGRDELAGRQAGGDTMEHQAVLSYFPGRSGDLMIAWKPNWIESPGTTTHGTGYRYDTHVPVLLMGRGIARGEYLTPAAPTDVAPTLAFLAGVTLPQASGRVLSEAIAVAAPPQPTALGPTFAPRTARPSPTNP